MRACFLKITNSTFLLVFLYGYLFSQTLSRRGDLGVLTSMTSNGLQVTGIYPGLTADVVGLQLGDIILEYNGIKINEANELKYWVEKSVAGDNLVIEVLRQKKKETILGKLVPAIYETSEKVDISYKAIITKIGTLRCIEYLPKEIKNPPAILYIQDFHHASIDLKQENFQPLFKIGETLAENGVAFIKVEKPGVGDSETSIASWDQGFLDEINWYKEVLDYVQGLDYINNKQLTLFAHAMGGNYVPLLNEKKSIKNIVLYGFYHTQKDKRMRGIRKENYWSEHKNFAALKSWSNIEKPILMLMPGFIEESKIKDAVDLQKRINKDFLEVIKLPNNDDSFLKFDSKEVYESCSFSPMDLDKYYDIEIVLQMIEWLGKKN